VTPPLAGSMVGTTRAMVAGSAKVEVPSFQPPVTLRPIRPLCQSRPKSVSAS
jgi:hypothetical protein